MLLSFQSKNEDYSSIKCNVDIPWSCKHVKYWVSSINFKANLYNITTDDYIILEYNNEDNWESFKITFENAMIDSDYLLLNTLNDNLEAPFRFLINDGHLSINSTADFVFTDISPRAKIVCGLLNAKLNQVYSADTLHEFDLPIYDFANKLYIISKQGSAVQTNIGSQRMTPSIIASIDTVIRNGIPIIVNFETFGKPIKTKSLKESFTYIELQLVDILLQPVQLLSPMFITMKVKPCKIPAIQLSK